MPFVNRHLSLDMSKNKQTENIAAAYPQLSRKECDEAEFHLGRYLGVVKRIFERAKRDNPSLLTDLQMRANVRKRDNKSSQIELSDRSTDPPNFPSDH